MNENLYWGRNIQDYELFDLLGKGGFASVYRARCKGISKDVAIKVIDRSKFTKQDGTLSQRVQDEISIHSQLDHASIVKLYTHFEDKNYIYLVLELCKNGDLEKYRKSHGVGSKLSEDEAKHFMKQVLYGMNYLKEMKIMHRDFKPSNLLLDSNYCIKIADFGMAARILPYRTNNTICGTPHFMCPEVATGSCHDEKADIWSFGILLFTLLIGREPFKSKNIGTKGVLTKVVTEDVKIPPNSGLSPSATDLILKCSQKNAKNRISIDEIFKHPFILKQDSSLRKDSTFADSGMYTCSTQHTTNRLPALGEHLEEYDSMHKPVEHKEQIIMPPPLHTARINPSSRDVANYQPQSSRTDNLRNKFTNPLLLPRMTKPTDFKEVSGQEYAFSDRPALTRSDRDFEDFHKPDKETARSEPNYRSRRDQYHLNEQFEVYSGNSNCSNPISKEFHGQSTKHVLPKRSASADTRPGLLNYHLIQENDHVQNSDHCSKLSQNSCNHVGSDINRNCSVERNSANMNHHRRSPSPNCAAQSLTRCCNQINCNCQPIFNEGNNIAHNCHHTSTNNGQCSSNHSVNAIKNNAEGLYHPSPSSLGYERNHSKKQNYNTNKPEKMKNFIPFFTNRLLPNRSVTKNIIFTLLANGDVCVEKIKNRELVVKVVKITRDGMWISMFRPNRGKGIPASTEPPKFPEEEGAEKIYSFDNMPESEWPMYKYAASYVKMLKEKTPKVTYYSDQAKCQLMESDPPKFEATFYSGIIFDLKDEVLNIMQKNKCIYKMHIDTGQSSLPENFHDLYNHFLKIRQYCLSVEKSLTAVEMETKISSFPAILGTRPKNNPKHNVEKENISPTKSNPNIQQSMENNIYQKGNDGIVRTNKNGGEYIIEFEDNTKVIVSENPAKIRYVQNDEILLIKENNLTPAIKDKIQRAGAKIELLKQKSCQRKHTQSQFSSNYSNSNYQDGFR